jgi:hypothetical protein
VVVVVVHLIVVIMAATHEMAYGDFGPVTEEDYAAATLAENTCSGIHVKIVVVVVMVGVLVKAVMYTGSSEFGYKYERYEFLAGMNRAVAKVMATMV